MRIGDFAKIPFSIPLAFIVPNAGSVANRFIAILSAYECSLSERMYSLYSYVPSVHFRICMLFTYFNENVVANVSLLTSYIP